MLPPPRPGGYAAAAVRRLAALTCAAAALAVAGCGSDDGAPGGNDEQAIESVIKAAASNREPCEHLTDRYLREFISEGVTSSDPREACEQAEAGQQKLSDDQVEVSDVKVMGDTATASFSVGPIGPQSAKLVKQGEKWLIDDFPL